MRHLFVTLTVASLLSACGVADVTSGAGELADTGDRLVSVIEDANRNIEEQMAEE